MRSRVVSRSGATYLEVEGRLIPGAAYMTYFSEKNRYGDFAKAGYKLYSVSVFFGSNYVNNSSALECFSPGIFDGEAADFSRFDLDVRRILEVSPDAMIFPRLNVNPPRGWDEDNPEELTDKGPRSRPEGKRPCLGSDRWADWVKEHLRLFVEHIKESDFGNSIIGYQLAGGQTEEWFAYDENCFIGKRSLEKYRRYLEEKGISDSERELYAFHARLCAERICELCGYVKELTGGEQAVGAFYGYTLELADRKYAHHALGLMLERDEVDFICSPISYCSPASSEGRRGPAADNVYMVPADSHKLHGKLYFLECDSRTHLSKPPFEHPRFESPVWYGYPKEITLELLLMHFSKCLVHGHSFWWFDMWGGWFADGDYMEFMARALKLAEASVGLPMESLAEVAVFVDENAYFDLSDGETAERVVKKMRLTLGQMGVPYDVYLASDFERVRDRYKAYITLEPTGTELYAKIAEYARAAGRLHLVINGDNANISTGELRDLLSSGGVSVISQRDAVIYYSESYLFVHTSEEGDYSLSLPFGITLYDAFTGKECDKSFKSERGRSYLFRLR